MRLIKSIQNRETNTSLALYDAGYGFLLETATCGLYRRQVLEEIEHDGTLADRSAARQAALGRYRAAAAEVAEGTLRA